MKLLVLWLSFAVLSSSLGINPATEEEEWEEWKARYGKSYPTDEEDEDRRNVWLENYDYVNAHNDRNDATFKLELNKFADELSAAVIDPEHEGAVHEEILVKDMSAPKQFDWRKKGVVGAVKNQGEMGYVEAYVAAECVESLHAIQTGKLFDLSAAEVAACCQASLQLPIDEDVFGCIHKIGGLCTDATYKPTSKCSNTSCEPVAQTQGTKFVPANNEGALLEALLTVPVFVTINASPQSFLLYKSGVYSDPQCTGRFLDHVLQLVGYGTDEEGNPYWICRNSWGEAWGMGGYVNIQRGVNRCGIAEDAKYPY
ncbi:cathepsin L-like peptidase [Haliotis cracherodii]|uniref:cathepsin L-like peptidase n=1 Tax=Haliotis cracherodii TaxID=6455 RepID=UPI0039E8B00D